MATFKSIALIMLQMFAGEGPIVNATTGFNNHMTGAHQEFDGSHKLTAGLKTFYRTVLLENAKPDVFYAQFAKKQPLPKGSGRTVEWRKWNTFEKAKELQEGVIPSGQKFGQTVLTGSIKQYGTFVALTDVIQTHYCDPIVVGATEEMGSSEALTMETLIRDSLLTNKTVMYCDNVDLATGKADAATPTSCAQMEATNLKCALLTPRMVNRAVTYFKKHHVPTINGKYYAVIHPSVAEDLRNSDGWMEAHKYARPEEIMNGEIGELHGCRFIENPFAPVLSGPTYQNKATTATYATYFFGKDAFGIIDPEGGGVEMIVKGKGEIGGPLEQYSTVGYKFETNGATVLYPERMIRMMSCSSYSDVDETNYDGE